MRRTLSLSSMSLIFRLYVNRRRSRSSALALSAAASFCARQTVVLFNCWFVSQRKLISAETINGDGVDHSAAVEDDTSASHKATV